MGDTLGSLGILVGLCQLAYLASAFGLGGLLVVRGRRGDDPLQVLLGVHLLLAIGLAYLLLAPAHVVGDAQPRAWLPVAVGAGYGTTILGLFATLVFNVRVFRPESATARRFAWAVAALMVLGWVGLGVVDGFPVQMRGPWFAAMMSGIVATNAWVAWEPLRYHRGMRRRQRLGLADPLLVDRFRLWGVGSVLRLALALSGVIGAPARDGMTPEAAEAFTRGVLVVTSLLGLGVSVAYFLTFRPAGWYVAWVKRRAARG